MIELLTVIAIVTLLAGLLLPTFRAAREQARIAQSTSNLRQLALANLTYETENGRYAPATNQRNTVRWHGARRSDGSFDPTRGYLSPYINDGGAIRVCPLLADWELTEDSFEDGSGGYGYNGVYIGGSPGDFTQPARASRIRKSRTVMFTTTALAKREGIQEYPFAEPPFWDFGNGPTRHRPDASVHFRARGQALVAWMDGSVTRERPAVWGENSVYGGDPQEHQLGWFGPEEENGYWNPRR